MTTTQFLDLPDGRLAYDDTGDGPLIVCIPAMLDLRSELRFLTPLLVKAGFRVVTFDQRGMGETDAVWPAYGSTPMAHDLIALLRHLGAGPALIYGTSNGSAAGVYAAAEAPELIRGLILAAPFVRDGEAPLLERIFMSIMRIPGLARPLYLSYFPKWEPNRPADFDEHKAKLGWPRPRSSSWEPLIPTGPTRPPKAGGWPSSCPPSLSCWKGQVTTHTSSSPNRSRTPSWRSTRRSTPRIGPAESDRGLAVPG